MLELDDSDGERHEVTTGDVIAVCVSAVFFAVYLLGNLLF